MSIEFISGLRFGALGPKTLHLCIDMQLMFAMETKWASGAIWQALPGILEISGRYTSQTVFTRFICPRDLSETTEQWTCFYADAEGMLSSKLHPSMMDLLPELAKFIPPAKIVDRKVFSALASPELRALLTQGSIDTLVMTGLKPMSACWQPCWRQSTWGSGWCLSKTPWQAPTRQGRRQPCTKYFPGLTSKLKSSQLKNFSEIG